MGTGSARLRRLLLALTVALVAWDSTGDAADPPPPPDRAKACETYGRPTRSGNVPDPLEELSGLVASRTHDGIYWSHNDSGNAFELFALDASGAIRARFPLEGATPRDIEDIAVGPCGEGADESCVFLGDIGDNRYRRPEARIYRMPEPSSLDGQVRTVEVLRFRWPEKPRNAEAMVVDPTTGAVYVWTKETRSLGVVHRLEGLRPDATGQAVAVTEIRAPGGAGLPTGADVHPGGDRLLIRTYSAAWELRRPGSSTLEDVLEAEPIEVPVRIQSQSEAIAYTHDGLGYLIATEGAGGPIYAVGCAEPETGSSRSSS